MVVAVCYIGLPLALVAFVLGCGGMAVLMGQLPVAEG